MDEEASTANSLWGPYLLNGERVQYTSRVKKYRHLSVKTRQLVLTDAPRLFYIDVEAGKTKGDVPWSDTLRVVPKTTTKFTVKTPKRDYEFNDLNGGGTRRWFDAIEAVKTQATRS